MHTVPRSANVVHPLKQVELQVFETFHQHQHRGALLTQIMCHPMAPTEGIKLQKSLCCFQFRLSPCLGVAEKKTLASKYTPLLSERVIGR